MRLVWSLRARKRRLEIIRYISKQDKDAARGMDMLFRASAKGLLVFPYKGIAGRIAGTRELTVHRNYIMVYSVHNDYVEIVSIIHTSQLYPSPGCLQ